MSGTNPPIPCPSPNRWLLVLPIVLIACGDGGATDGESETSAYGPNTSSTSTEPTGLDGSGISTTLGTSSASDTTAGVEAGLLERLVAALGGEQALTGLESVELEVSGQRWASAEGVTPRGSMLPSGEYTATISIDIAAASMRLEQARMSSIGFPLSYAEIIVGQLGYVEGVDNIWGAPSAAMESDRVASTVRQQQLFNPQLLVRDALANPSRATEIGAQDYNERPHELLELEGTVRPIVLWVDSETALISRLTTVENNPLWRDVELEVVFADWSLRPGGVAFPGAVTLSINGQILAQETRSAVTGGVELDPSLFELADPGEYVADDAARGERNHGFLQERFSLGIPLDIEQPFVSPLEIAPGIWHLTGGSHHSMLVEQSSGLVLIETPLAESRCNALLAWISDELPGVMISHAVVSHLTVDHAACARTLVAQGATLIVGESAGDIWPVILAAASTVEPDALAANPVVDPPLELAAVDGGVTIEDEIRTVTVYGMLNPLSTDFVLPYVDGFAFVNDLFNPGQTTPAGAAGAQAILDALEQHGLLDETTTLVGGHGGTATVAELQAAAGS